MVKSQVIYILCSISKSVQFWKGHNILMEESQIWGDNIVNGDLKRFGAVISEK